MKGGSKIERLRNLLEGSAMSLGCIGHMALGLLYLNAIAHGLYSWLGLPWFLSYFMGYVLASSPILGIVIAIAAAINVWAGLSFIV